MQLLKNCLRFCELVWKCFSDQRRHEVIDAGALLGAPLRDKPNIYWYFARDVWFKLAYIKGRPHGWSLKRQLFIGLAREVWIVLKLGVMGGLQDRWILPYRVRNAIEQRRLAKVEPFKFQKKYIVTLPDIPESLAGAKQCMRTAERFGEREGMEIFPGIDKHHSEEFFRNHELTWSYPHQCTNRELASRAEMGCFASHYLLWRKCVELGEPIMVLEDDTEFRAPVPALKFRDFIYLGEPVFRRPGKKHALRKLPLSLREVYYPFRSSAGTWAYGISPTGAEKLLRSAQEAAVRPADNFITPSKVHMLFYRPQPLKTSIDFSLIRKVH